MFGTRTRPSYGLPVLLASVWLLTKTLAGYQALVPSPPAEEVTLSQSSVQYVATKAGETVVRGRPWVPNRRIATVGSNTRLLVLGEVKSRDKAGCSGKPWYAVMPFGFVCSNDVTPTKKAPSSAPALTPPPGKRMPFSYAFVKKGGSEAFAGTKGIEDGVATRYLRKGMSLVIDRTMTFRGETWAVTNDGWLVPRGNIYFSGEGSAWQGVWIDGTHAGDSFAWVNRNQAKVYDAPGKDAKIIGSIKLRERVPLLDRKSVGRVDFLRIGEGQWMSADDLNEVRLIARPDPAYTAFHRAAGTHLWFDVDTGEQVVVAYQDNRPFFATLVASGKGMPTPLGDYPVWAKVGSMTMANQAYEDDPYMVQGVPWVLLFQGHNAFHGAYWHDRFGNRKSHGCVNLSPLDARTIFESALITLPEGWTGFLPPELQSSPVVHVRDSSRPGAASFTQERTVGPPDREAERARMEEAQARREEDPERERLLQDNFLKPGETVFPTRPGG